MWQGLWIDDFRHGGIDLLEIRGTDKALQHGDVRAVCGIQSEAAGVVFSEPLL